MKYLIFILLLSIVITSKASIANEQSIDIGIASSMTKIFQDITDINKLSFQDWYSIDIAKDESESFQIVLIPFKDCDSIKILNLSSDFTNDYQISFNKVGYVKTGNPTYSVEKIGLWPDPLLPIENIISVQKNKIQPIWCRITTKHNCAPGSYFHRIGIFENNKMIKEIKLTIKIRNFTIPRPGVFQAPFGAYKHVLDRWYKKQKELSVEEYKVWAEFLGKYRLTPKNIGGEFINRNNTKDNKCDFSDLKKLLKDIETIYYPEYTYEMFRLPSAITIEKYFKEGKHITPEEFATPAIKHIKEWKANKMRNEVFVYGFDEPQSDTVISFAKQVYQLIKKELPTIKILQTGNCKNNKLIGAVDIWCPKSNIAWDPFFKQRLADGDLLWQYTCVSPNPPFNNLFVDEPGLHHRLLFWQTYKIGASGFLYWTVTWLNGLESPKDKNVFSESTFDFKKSQFYLEEWCHSNGDGLLVYPGKDMKPLPSQRLEIIRDGIEDYEYFKILSNLISKIEKIPEYQTAGPQNLLNSARKLLTIPDNITKNAQSYTSDIRLLLQHRKEIADMIEQLTDIIENKDYKLWKYKK